MAYACKLRGKYPLENTDSDEDSHTPPKAHVMINVRKEVEVFTTDAASCPRDPKRDGG